VLRFRTGRPFSKGAVRSLFLFTGALFFLAPVSAGPTSGAPAGSAVEKGLQIKRDGLTGAPLILRSREKPLLVLPGISGWDRRRITGVGPLLVTKYRSLLRIRPEDLRLKGAERIDGTWYVSYWQTFRGMILYESSLGFSIDNQGRVPSLGALLYPGVTVPELSKVSREKALAAARAQVPDFEKMQYRLLAENTVIYPDRRRDRVDYYRVYAFNFFPEKALHPASAIGGWAVFVDSQTGRVIRKHPLFKPMGCCVPENWTPPKTEEVYKGILGN
jgi:hypothetical protein